MRRPSGWERERWSLRAEEMGRGEQRERSTHPPSSSGHAGPGQAGTRTPGCPHGCAAPPRQGTRDCHSARTPGIKINRNVFYFGWPRLKVLCRPTCYICSFGLITAQHCIYQDQLAKKSPPKILIEYMVQITSTHLPVV